MVFVPLVTDTSLLTFAKDVKEMCTATAHEFILANGFSIRSNTDIRHMIAPKLHHWATRVASLPTILFC